MRFSAHLAVVFALTACSPTTPAVAQSGAPPGHDPYRELRRELERALAVPALRRARLSVLVVGRRSGRTVFARDPGRPLVPASNQKLLTAAAALAHFGPAHRFETRVLATAPIDSAGTVARLYVVGDGDPTLTSEALWRLAADLRRAGLRRITAGIVLDDTAFDRQLWHPSWGAPSARAYSAPVGALSVNYGAFAVEVAPGAAEGARARVDLDPPLSHHFALVNAVTTAPRGAATRLVAARELAPGGERVLVKGVVARGAAPRVLYRSTLRPTLYAGAMLRRQLEANGIRVEGSLERGIATEEGHEILTFAGKKLTESANLLMKYSNNQIAECLVKALGRDALGAPGSWDSGVAVLRRQLQALGIDLRGARVVDGSGLSRDNRLSARIAVDVLTAVDRSFDLAPEFFAALPIAARDGTLEDRAERSAGRLRAKTGRMSGVSALSGWAQGGRGGGFLFSIIVNGKGGSEAAIVRAIDRFAAALTRDRGAGTAAGGDQEPRKRREERE